MRSLLVSMTLAVFPVTTLFGQGLDPSAAPAPTPGPEPRTPISEVPFTITESGSYYLTANLTAPNEAGLDGIRIQASEVTLDLNGFTLRSAGSLTDDGIVASDELDNITIRNGSVLGWGGNGIDAFMTENQRLIDVTARSNGRDGILSGASSTMERCNAVGNGEVGIRLDSSSVAIACTARQNGSVGFSVSFYCTLRDCTFSDNGNNGVFAQSGVNIVNCTASGNGASGISVAATSRIQGSVARFNGLDGFNLSGGSIIESCISSQNERHGISASGTRILNNTVSGNGAIDSGVGIRVFSSCVVDGNVVTDNSDGGIVEGSDLTSDCLIVRNRIEGTSSGPDLGVGLVDNTAGPTVTGYGTIVSTNPWANFVP